MIAKPRLNSLRYADSIVSGPEYQTIENAMIHITRQGNSVHCEIRDKSGRVIDWMPLPLADGETMQVGPFDFILDIALIRGA